MGLAKITSSTSGKVFIGALTAFQLVAVGHDLRQNYLKKHQSLNTASNISSLSLSPLSIALCDTWQGILEYSKSSFISVDTGISALLGFLAFFFPQYKALSNDLHALQILKYAGYAVRSNDKFSKEISKEKNFFKRWNKEVSRSLDVWKEFMIGLPKIHKWGGKLIKSPIKTFANNSSNLFMMKSFGELLAGTAIILADIAIIIKDKMHNKDFSESQVNKHDDNNKEDYNNTAESIKSVGWGIIKFLYLVNGLAWLAKAMQSKPGKKITMPQRLSETGLGMAKGLHAVFANNPAIAFPARALERFFYLTTSFMHGNKGKVKLKGGKR